MAVTTDAVIVGGGVMGTSILYNLVLRGLKSAVLLERDTLGSGSTGRSSGAIRMHYSTEVNARLAWESLKIFQNWDSKIGGADVGFVKTGYMVFVPQEAKSVFNQNIEMQQNIGIATEIVDIDEARELAPAFNFDESEGFAWESESGHGDPSGTALGYSTRARDMGASVILESPVTGVEIVKNKVTAVETAHERYETPIAVIATGPWSRRFLAELGIDLPLKPTRHEVILLKRPPDIALNHPGGGDMSNLIYFRPEGSDLTLVGNGNREEEVDPNDYNQKASMDFVEDIWSRLARRIPGIENAELFTGYAGLYTSTPDLHQVVDKVDGVEGLYICTGFSGHGFKLSPAVGIVLSELILDGRAQLLDISPLRMSRFESGELNTTRYSFKVIA